MVALSATLASLLVQLIAKPHTTSSSLISDAWQIHAAFAAAALPILIFVIEIAKGDKTIGSRTADVLIVESRVFPVMLLLLGLTPLFALGVLSVLEAVALLGLGLSAVGYAYGKTLQLLLDQHALRQGERKLLRWRIAENVRATLEGRIALNLLSAFVEERGAQFRFWHSRPSSGELPLFLPTAGRVKDINLVVLGEIIDLFPPPRLSSASPRDPDEAPIETEVSTGGDDAVPPRVTLVVSLDQPVAADRPVLLLHILDARPAMATRLNATVARAFRIAPQAETERLDPLRNDLLDIRRSIQRAIRDHDEVEVGAGLALYYEMVDSFINELHTHGLTYDQELASQESQLFSFGDWEPIDWLQDDLRTLLIEGFKHPDSDVIGSLLYFPMKLLRLGVEEGDYLPFKRLVRQHYPFAYQLALKLSDSDTKALAIDRIWRFPMEVAGWVVTGAVGRARNPSSITRLTDHAEGLLLLFNDLLKRAFDADRFDDFQAFSIKMATLFGTLVEELPDAHGWEMEKEYELGVRHFTELEREIYKAADELDERLDLLENMIRWGLESWIIRKTTGQWQSTQPPKRWMETTAVHGSLRELGERLLLSRAPSRFESLLGWHWWEMEGIEEGVFSRSAESDESAAVYLKAALHVVAANQPAPADFPPTKDFEHLVKDDAALLPRVLTEMLNDTARWGDLLPANAPHCAQLLRDAWNSFLTEQAARYEREVIEAPLDSAQVSHLREAVKAGFAQRGAFFRLLEKWNAIEKGLPPGPDAPQPRGFFNRLMPKQFFVQGALNVYGWDGYGNEAAADSVNQALQTIVEGLAAPEAGATPDIVSFIGDAARELTELGYRPVAMILNSWRARSILWDHPDEFRPSAGARVDGLIGTISDLPVYNLQVGGDLSLVLVADFEKLGTLRFYLPDAGAEGEVLDNALRFSLRAIDRDVAGMMVDRHPNLRQGEEGAELPRDEAIDKLLGRVIFELDVRARFEIQDSAAGRLLVLHED